VPDTLVGRPLAELFDETSRDAILEQVERVFRSAANDISLAATFQISGKPATVILRFVPVNLSAERVIGLIFRQELVDITASENDTWRRDPLTGLWDREFLQSRLADRLRGGRAADLRFAVLFVDLNNFKDVNDRHGHLIGDRVLREAARRLAGSVREGDYVVRYGGDEFVVLVDDVLSLQELQPIIARIEAAICKPMVLPEDEVTLSMSVGGAIAAPEFRTPEALISAADQAMYAAKRRK
jgi:diguanylate cyclase (GGDEF)-like protein